MLRPLAFAALLLAAPAGAQELRIAMKAAVDSADPHLTYTPNRNVGIHVFETLVEFDPQLRPVPGLAESWRPVDELTWEFTLREGVRFHDGTPFIAEDAAFSIRRAQSVTGARTYANAVRNIRAAEARDARTLILHMKAPTPLQPNFIAQIGMVSARAAADAAEADFNGGRAAIGTGPYRWVRWTPGQDVVLDRAPTWRGTPEPWSRVTFRVISNDSARVAALLAGDVDVIDTVPAGLQPRVRESDRTQLVSIDSIFTHYFYMDSMSARIPNATGTDGQPLPQNPLRDGRVRRAMTHAINRVALAERAMEGGATPAGQVSAPGFLGHDPGIPVPVYDPALSRKLLAEAGYPGGFNLTIQCTNDRFAGDARVCQAIGQMLTMVGIRTTVDALPTSVYFRRGTTLTPTGEPELSAHLSMYGSTTGIGTESLTSLIRTINPALAHGGWNRTRYSNPELDRLLTLADEAFDPAERERAMQAAIRYAVDNQALLPVFFVKMAWGLRRGLTMPPRGDGFTMATAIRPAP
ncbi:ABC transporter substrate-binding protein [Belnapia sp. T6]|uniref:ABC transporter substrate-binding protein n=1 Tax=Belnapia mucosa TaxID=2804532 RepID=A0ABS1V7H9_9PROT|nr:ABC transporter substrate-binding protein [Belnapia mucosa]MBL6456278.1 ABC transporter substrate-binding protein [Belnapia mucosa]